MFEKRRRPAENSTEISAQDYWIRFGLGLTPQHSAIWSSFCKLSDIGPQKRLFLESSKKPPHGRRSGKMDKKIALFTIMLLVFNYTWYSILFPVFLSLRVTCFYLLLPRPHSFWLKEKDEKFPENPSEGAEHCYGIAFTIHRCQRRPISGHTCIMNLLFKADKRLRLAASSQWNKNFGKV